MANSYFRFKQFTVDQELCAMKVGTDGVLLGAWANTEEAKYILDIGTGTGLIALMLAQRSNCNIDAIDIDGNAYRQAMCNFERSPFGSRLYAFRSGLQDFYPDRQYNLIVSNPPYFSNSLLSPYQGKNIARHDSNLSLEELISHSSRLLSPSGRINLILPFEHHDRILGIASGYELHLTRKTTVFPTHTSAPKRILLEFSRINRPAEINELVIEEKRHAYTQEYKNLTSSYYL